MKENKSERMLSVSSLSVLKLVELKAPAPTEERYIGLQRGSGSWLLQADTLPWGQMSHTVQNINTDLLQCEPDVAGGAGEAIHTPGLVKS